MCPYLDTWVMGQKASAALKYMRGVGAEPSPPRDGPSSQAKVLCAAPLWLTVASLRNGVTDCTSATNVISRLRMVGSRPSGSCPMGSPFRRRLDRSHPQRRLHSLRALCQCRRLRVSRTVATTAGHVEVGFGGVRRKRARLAGATPRTEKSASSDGTLGLKKDREFQLMA